MDAFFLPFLAAAVAEWGDKTQILAMLLAARFQRPGLVLGGVALAAFANSAIGAFGGSLIVPLLTSEARLLFLALAFALAGAGAFLPFRDPGTGLNWRIGALATAFLAFFLVEFGDKTQFVTAGFGAVLTGWPIVAFGAAAGVMLASAPAVMLGSAFRSRFPLALMRRSAGGLLLLIGAILAINAFALI